MDVFALLDRLDDLLSNAKAIPFTGQVRVDRAEMEDIIDQMRATIPEEIKQARAIVARERENATDDERGLQPSATLAEC
jgi:hypothetical protein